MSDSTQAGLYAVDVDGEILIWDPHGEALHRLNASAARVWRDLASGKSPDAITNDIVRSSGRDIAVVRDEVDGCLDELEEAGLVPPSTTGAQSGTDSSSAGRRAKA